MANAKSLLTDDEYKLIRATEPARLQKADEEKLLNLHARIRRARNKYSKNYRRGAASRVAKDRSRAYASKGYHRTAQKAEIFETALSRVSDALAAESKRSAKAIKKERLDAASKTKKGTPPRKGKGSTKARSTGSGKGKAKAKTPASKKQRASTRASGKRSQARRDKR